MVTDKKLREQQTFFWAADGHRLNIYLNCYLNIPVRVDKFKDYVACGLEKMAAQFRAEAAKDRSAWLLTQAQVSIVVAQVVPEEQKEVAREEKAADRLSAREEGV